MKKSSSGIDLIFVFFLRWLDRCRSRYFFSRARCPELHTVDFGNCRSLTDKAVLHLARCAKLQCANFEFCRNLTDASVQHVAQCPQLKSVKFPRIGPVAAWCARLSFTNNVKLKPNANQVYKSEHNSWILQFWLRYISKYQGHMCKMYQIFSHCWYASWYIPA